MIPVFDMETLETPPVSSGLTIKVEITQMAGKVFDMVEGLDDWSFMRSELTRTLGVKITKALQTLYNSSTFDFLTRIMAVQLVGKDIVQVTFTNTTLLNDQKAEVLLNVVKPVLKDFQLKFA